MNLLQRHLFWSVFTACLAAVGLFAFVLILGNALRDLLGFVLAQQIPVETFVTLLAMLVPYAGAYALPMGILTGVLLVLGRMSAQHEITAMRAAGLSLGFVARPILLLGAAGMVVALAINYEFMPRARTAYKETMAAAVRQNPLSFIVPRTFIRDFPNVVVYVGERDEVELRDFWVWQLDREKRTRIFARAESGRFDYDEDANTLVLTLREVVVETRNERDPEDFARPPQTAAFEEFPIKLELDAIFGRQTLRKKPSWLTLDELLTEQRRLAALGPDAAQEHMRVSLALHEKATSSLAVLAFAFIAVPLGIKVSRSETSANLGVALGLVMGYYFLTVMVGWLENYPAWRPDLLLWVPPLLFLGLGVWLFRRVGRA